MNFEFMPELKWTYGYPFAIVLMILSAVLPWLALHGSDAWSDDRLSIHQLQPSPARELYLYWPAGRTQSPLATRAIDIAVEAARELTKHESA